MKIIKNEFNPFEEPPLGSRYVLLSDIELHLIVQALEKLNGGESELGNDIKMVLKGNL